MQTEPPPVTCPVWKRMRGATTLPDRSAAPPTIAKPPPADVGGESARISLTDVYPAHPAAPAQPAAVERRRA